MRITPAVCFDAQNDTNGINDGIGSTGNCRLVSQREIEIANTR